MSPEYSSIAQQDLVSLFLLYRCDNKTQEMKKTLQLCMIYTIVRILKSNVNKVDDKNFYLEISSIKRIMEWKHNSHGN